MWHRASTASLRRKLNSEFWSFGCTEKARISKSPAGGGASREGEDAARARSGRGGPREVSGAILLLDDVEGLADAPHEISRDSPRFAEIRRDSPRFAEIRRGCAARRAWLIRPWSNRWPCSSKSRDGHPTLPAAADAPSSLAMQPACCSAPATRG